MCRLHARVVDQPRGAAEVRDATFGRGAGPTRGTVPSAPGRPPGAGCSGDRVRPAPTAPSPNDDPVGHVAEPAPEEEPLDVFHQYGDGALVAPQEEGHIPALQPSADVRDPHVGRGGPVRRAGDPRPERVTGCAHPLCLHSHFVAAAAAPAPADNARRHAERPAATCTATAAADRSAHPRVRACTGAQLADQPAAPTGANAPTPITGHRGDECEQLHWRERWVSNFAFLINMDRVYCRLTLCSLTPLMWQLERR